MHRRVLPALAGAGALVVMLAMLPPSAAAHSTAAQQNALRQYCRSEFNTVCRGIRSSKNALLCLQANVTRLSRGCEKVVLATMPGDPDEAVPQGTSRKQIADNPPPPQAETHSRAASINAAQPQNARLSSAQANRREASVAEDAPEQADAAPEQDEQQQPANAAPQRKGASTHRTAARTEDAEPPEALPPQKAARTQKGMPTSLRHDPLVRACLPDLQRHCRGMRAGGGRELACLSKHTHSLTRSCYAAYRTATRTR